MATLPVTITAAEAVSLGGGNEIAAEALKRAQTASRVLFEKEPGKATLVVASLRVRSLSMADGDYAYVFEVPEGTATPMIVDDLSEDA